MSRLFTHLMGALICAPLLASTAHAHGDHGSKIDIKNNAPANLCVHTFNGKDSSRSVPHKTYHIAPGKSETVKCHGESKNRCYVKLYRHKNGDGIKDACAANDRARMMLFVADGSLMAEKDTCTYNARKPNTGIVDNDAVSCGKSASKVTVVDPNRETKPVDEDVCDVHRRDIPNWEIRFKYRRQKLEITGCKPFGDDMYLTLPKRDYFNGTGSCGPGQSGLLASGTDGCSGGAKGDREIFHAACNLHDACYRSGRGFTRKQCDDHFLENMRHICTLYPGVLNTCLDAARVFHIAVDSAGEESWDNKGSKEKRTLCAAE